MDALVRLLGIAFVSTVLLVFLRGAHAPMATPVAAAFVILATGLLLRPLGEVVALFIDIGRRAGVQGLYLDVILRAVSVALLATIGAQISRDAGEGGIAALVELTGKVSILVLAAPVLLAILERLSGLLP